MRDVQQWLDAYGESHQNPTNKMIHWVCIPWIVISLLALLSLVKLPLDMPGMHLGTLLMVGATLYYAVLSRPLALGMAFVGAASLAMVAALAQLPIPLWMSALGIFVVAWIGQFIGHKIEGKKPSFFEDLQFLLIGPMWLLAAAYRKAGLRY